MDAKFLDLYDRELTFLREMGGVFAQQYPKLAGRLGWDEFQCSDPFVERLLEGFAFMAARVHRRLDAEFPELSQAILDTVFPLYGRPVPSAAIFQLLPKIDEASLVSGYTIPRGTRLHAEPAPGQQTGCRFDTSWDVDLWPIAICDVECISRDRTTGWNLPREFHGSTTRSLLKLTLETTIPVTFDQLPIRTLRLHLRGDEIALQLYEHLLAHMDQIAIAGSRNAAEPGEHDWQLLPNQCISAVGMRGSESILPHDHRSFSGYRLLQEYFLLPEKFLFVDLNLEANSLAHCHGNRLHLLIGFDKVPDRLVGRASKDHISLHCVPALNLFSRRADRVILDHSESEHQLVCDRSRPADYEVWSIEDLALHDVSRGREIACVPLYAPDRDTNKTASLNYHAQRRPRITSGTSSNSLRSSYLGSELFISLSRAGEQIGLDDFQQMSASVMCTQRDLPLLVPEGGWRRAFQAENPGPIDQVICITGPTEPREPLTSQTSSRAWRLVSHLTPNYLSYTENEAQGADMLRELLRLYCHDRQQSAHKQIEGLTGINNRSIVRRVAADGPIAFVRGVELQLIFDENTFGGKGAFLLASVLERFFSRYVTVNSFTETCLTTVQRGDIYRWPARSGSVRLI